MLRTGILNPGINSLLSRVRHTNTLVICDRGFPYRPDWEIIDISLVADIPRVVEVLQAIRENFQTGKAFMAQEFYAVNSAAAGEEFKQALSGVALTLEPHLELKRRAASATGLIRTGDTIRFANVILESA